MSLMTFIIRPESIFLGFLRGFFEQERLFDSFPNEFKNIPVQLSESQEYVNHFPIIVLQEGGFNENIRATNNDLNVEDFANQKLYYNGMFIHAYTIHCIGANKGQAKLLQSIVTRAISVFRKSIYEMGVDNISPIQGSPPMRMTSQDSQTPTQKYDCSISFQVAMSQQWVTTIVDDEKSGIYPEDIIRLSILAGVEEIGFDESGAPLPGDWFRLDYKLEQ